MAVGRVGIWWPCVPFSRATQGRTPIPRAVPPAPGNEPKESLTTQKGRPLVCLQVNGKTTVCFLDTGSEVTIVNEAHVNMLPGVRMLQTSQSLQGVSGPPKTVVAEADLTFRLHPDFVLTHRTCVATVVYFPGDVLLGMDLLHRLSFRLIHSPASSLLEVNGHYHQITYTGEESKCVHEASAGEVNDKCGKKFQHISPMHVAERIVIPAQSGCFVPANLTRGMPPDAHLAIIEGNATCLTVPRTLISVHERRSSVWVVKTDQRARKLSPGTILGYAEIVQLEEVTRADDHDTQGSGPLIERRTPEYTTPFVSTLRPWINEWVHECACIAAHLPQWWVETLTGSVPSSRATTPTSPPAVGEASGGDAPVQELQNSGDPRAAAPQPPPDVHDMLSAALSRISVLEEVIAATRSENARCQPLAREEPPPVGHSNVSQVPHLIPQEPTSYVYPTHALGVHPAAPASTRQALSGRDEIPVFCGETPASQALQRNREVEAWISTIEMPTQPATV
ncbi:uncharacterized protein LOC119594849 [Penaeus monodon]|uniref:uncharacterized protein LOC119594849 n=1 Tax=Penaeus monodon TaxID=6687 RepID=UPI0018A749E8|nr:uncharacterized protein LOC119594849 [Penaeus monodon]